MAFEERSKEGEATRERALVARLRQFIEDSDLSFYKIASRSKSLIGRHFGPDRNEAGELLIGVFSSEIGKCGPECGCDRDDETAHLGVSADILNRFRVFDYRQLVRTCRNQEEQQTYNRKECTHAEAEYSSNFDLPVSGETLLFCYLHRLYFPAFS